MNIVIKIIERKRNDMKFVVFSILISLLVSSCSNTVSVPEDMYYGAETFDYSKKWDDYRPVYKPYNTLDMTNKSVSEINQLYGEPIFNDTDTIYWGKTNDRCYHNEYNIAYMFRGTPKIPLYEMWWKMKRDSINYILVLYCIDKDDDKYPVYGYAYNENHPLLE